MSNKNTIYNCLISLMDISRKQQLLYKEKDIKISSLLAYLKEFCTIKLNTSRQTGHTTSIVQLINNTNLNYYCLFLNQDLMNKFYKIDPKSINKNNLFTIKSFNEKLRGRNDKIDMIIIDNSYFLSKKNINQIYQTIINEKLYKNNEVFYVIFIQ